MAWISGTVLNKCMTWGPYVQRLLSKEDLQEDCLVIVAQSNPDGTLQGMEA